jgi:hypothetical protein
MSIKDDSLIGAGSLGPRGSESLNFVGGEDLEASKNHANLSSLKPLIGNVPYSNPIFDNEGVERENSLLGVEGAEDDEICSHNSTTILDGEKVSFKPNIPIEA